MPLVATARALVPVAASHSALTACLGRWSTASQQHARRNAMVASTALAQRRAEREDVEEFLAGLATQPGEGRPAALARRAAHG